jgi:hypothetical protein
MRINALNEHLGTASGIKVLRSVWIKGIEALLAERPLATRHDGPGEAVLASSTRAPDRPF